MILICIDGLSYDVLQSGMRNGFCPYLKHLVSTNTYVYYPYFCGLPAVTTASEAKLFYGDNYDIPGFAWFDRTAMQFIRTSRGHRIKHIEKRLRERYPHALLTGGSCFFGAFSGGASVLDYSAEEFDFTHPWSVIRKMKILLSALKAPQSLIRNTVHFFMSLPRDAKSAALHYIMGNLATFIARRDIENGTSSLFIDYPQYDDAAHAHGLESEKAFIALSHIDSYIKKLSRGIDTVVILSDHGQSPATYIKNIFGESIRGVVEKALQNKTKRVIQTSGTYNVKHADFRNDVFVIPSGGIVHIYFAERFLHPYKKNELDIKYPYFLNALIAHDSIGWLLVRISDSSAVLLGKLGSLVFEKGSPPQEIGAVFPTGLPYRAEIISSLEFYSTYLNNGDVVLFSNIHK
ncbi:MAG: alkaline phosphatase family protein, partial [Patescibacteria group bacterium]